MKKDKDDSIQFDLCEDHFAALHHDEKLKFELWVKKAEVSRETIVCVLLLILVLVVFVANTVEFSTSHSVSDGDSNSSTGSSGSGFGENGISASGDGDGDSCLYSKGYTCYRNRKEKASKSWEDTQLYIFLNLPLQLLPFTTVGVLLLWSSYFTHFTDQRTLQRFSGWPAFKPGWRGWSVQRQENRLTLFRILAWCLTPVMFVKQAFHEETQLSVGSYGPDGFSSNSGTFNPRFVFASTVCSAAAEYQCYDLNFAGPMYDCSDPDDVNALQNDKDITKIDCFRSLPFSLITYLDVFGIALGMVLLGMGFFDYFDGALIGKIDASRTTDLEGQTDSCFARCTEFMKKMVVKIGPWVAISGFAYILFRNDGWNYRQKSIEAAAFIPLIFSIGLTGAYVESYNEGTKRQTILEILFRRHGSTSGHWTSKSTESLLATVKPSASFGKEWLKNELPMMNGADLWHSFEKPWQRRAREIMKLRGLSRRNAVLCRRLEDTSDAVSEEAKAEIVERMNWSILTFASAVKNAMDQSAKANLSFDTVWAATWDIMDNDKELHKDGWWMLGPSFWGDGKYTDRGKVGHLKLKAVTTFSAGREFGTSTDTEIKGFDDSDDSSH
jgi:hypothetical protein